MNTRINLSTDEIAAALPGLPGWRHEDDRLRKEYRFADFVHAFGFMATAAIAIEKKDHHPEWTNVYNQVSVSLTTHDTGGVTSLDVELARLLESIARRLQ